MTAVTDSTAKTMVCPLMTSGKPNQPCQGTVCMFWRWQWSGNVIETTLENGVAVRLGYCGSAGRPGPRRAG